MRNKFGKDSLSADSLETRSEVKWTLGERKAQDHHKKAPNAYDYNLLPLQSSGDTRGNCETKQRHIRSDTFKVEKWTLI